jgi:uncharacterized protein (DUF2235 family)
MRNIVICCDGTGNEISNDMSNVLKLFRCLRKSERTSPQQLVFYDPGVGTLAQPDPWRKLLQDALAVFGLATGYGLDDNVLSAYEFLIENYEEGDELFMFGFSRGAYTVRVLAGLIHKVGLPRPQQRNLLGPALTAYKRYSESDGTERIGPDLRLLPGYEDGELSPLYPLDSAAGFARIVSSRLPTVRFLGVWDTVATVIVPRPDRFYIPTMQEIAYTGYNPSVRTFRQAASIDERRRMYRLKSWSGGQTFLPNRLEATAAGPQDSLQVWFAGVHADIGGSYPEVESNLSKYPLIWMIEEAAKCGLLFNWQTLKQLAWGTPRAGSYSVSYAEPDSTGPLHNSMTAAWRTLEYAPKAAKYKEWPDRKVSFGFYIPDAEPRVIPEGAFIHESVLMRMEKELDYRPVNLPRKFETVPMSGPREV